MKSKRPEILPDPAPAASAPERTEADVVKRRRRLLVLHIAILAVLFGMFSDYGFITRLQLEHRKAELQDSILSARSRHDSLARSADRLRFDTLEIERLAREKYGLSRPGEQVIILHKNSQP
ncbi:MAG: FtsB family cell division protein [Candidatus Kapaibacterium sp.]